MITVRVKWRQNDETAYDRNRFMHYEISCNQNREDEAVMEGTALAYFTRWFKYDRDKL
jgi:hypothetical protein